MNNFQKKVVTLIPSATEIVAFLGKKKSLIGRSHECDYPEGLNNISKLTSPKIKIDGKSGEINKEIKSILENSLSVYKVDTEKLKDLDPDFIITQAHCEACAVNFSEVKNIVNNHLKKKVKIISLKPNTLGDVLNDIRKVAKELNINNKIKNKLIGNLESRLKNIENLTSVQKIKPTVACIEWIDPLMAAGNWIPEMVTIAGGRDVLGKSGKNSYWIEFKKIKNYDPDIIIFLPCGFNIKKTKNELNDCIKKDRSWKFLKAFKEKKLFIADGNQFFNRPGPRLIESVEILAEIIHPKVFNFEHKKKGWIKFNPSI